MGRISRISIAAETSANIDLSTPFKGKIFIQNIGSNDVLVSYVKNPDGSAITAAPFANQYYTIMAGQAYTFDITPSTGYVVEDQNMFFYSVGGTTVEIWVTG